MVAFAPVSFTMAPPSNVAVLLENTQLVMVGPLSKLSTAPPTSALLPSKTQPVIVARLLSSFSMAPP